MAKITQDKKEKRQKIVTQILFVVTVALLWEIISKMNLFGSRSALLFPPLEMIMQAFISNFTIGYAGQSFWIYIANSMKLLSYGLSAGIILALCFSGLSIMGNVFFHIYNLTVSVCDLIPGVAILPVVIVIFGVKPSVIVFLVIHAVLWPMSRNILDGFHAVPQIYIEAGENIGLGKFSLLMGVYIPASASYIVSGLKVSWARAWRGLISAEMIFGIASCPGIGLYINQMRTNMKNAEMYATLIVIVIIGVIVQYGILEPLEKNTVGRWGMLR